VKKLAIMPDEESRMKVAFWAQGTQFDFYDQDPLVTIATDTAAAHFRRHLGH
jgi:hypothetical protein